MSSAFGITFEDPVLEKSVRAGLDAVEAALQDAVHADDEFVNGAASYLVAAGGKRFRPLVTMLAAHFGDAERPEIATAAVVIEITHLATLYHDDVMDEASVRRGAVSANARWDNTIAILTGDFLFSRASNLLADLGPHAVRLQAQTFERLVTGQIHETVGPQDGADAIEHYLGVLADKTGSLIATAAEFGAYFAGVDEHVISVLRRFGEQIGVAFQISDDILDIASDSDESGKTPGTDLREGVATLPVLYALRDAEPGRDPEAAADTGTDTGTDTAADTGTDAAADRDRLRVLVSGPLLDDGDHAEALELLRRSPALAQARETLRRYADDARAMLTELPEVPARAALEALCDLVIARTR